MNLLGRYRLARDRRVTAANLLDELVARKGDCPVSVDGDGVYYLSQLHAEVLRIHAFLGGVVGLKPGEPVAIYRTNDRFCFHWFLAVIRAGGIAVPLNPMLSLAEVRRILAESGTEILVTDKALFDRTIKDRAALNVRVWIQAEKIQAGKQEAAEQETMPGFERVPNTDADAGAPFPPPATVAPAATVAVFHTSGTSGFPKGAALSSNALLGARASTLIVGAVLGPRDLAFIALPWSHIMAVSIALYGLMTGVRGCFLDRFNVDAALDLVERHGVTTFVGVPAILTLLVNSNPAPSRLESVRVWLSASDYLPAEVRRRLKSYGALLRLPGGLRIPPAIVNGYGMVELGGLAMMGVELPLPGSSGDLCFPVPPFQIRIADEKDRRVKTGQTGECQIRRAGLAPHYWKDRGNDRADKHRADKQGDNSGGNQDLLTADGWLRTGDLARRNRLGLIQIVGRMKDVIKSGGYSVYVRELEEAVLAHPAIARAVAFGMPHKEKGEIPVAAVEVHRGSSASEDDLLAWCRENLAAYKAPRRIWILEPGAIPENHNGKALRRALRDRFMAQMK